VTGAILVGIVAGVVAGLTGTGGGSLFVPALVLFLGLGHLEAEATSLLAIIPVALVGAWRQHGYGNLRLKDGALVGALSVAGVAVGVALANVLSERTLRVAFAGLTLFTAVQLIRKALRREEEDPA
jgi:hypothetical protein